MKALTVKQPWAWAIARGMKTIENRTWWTNHRGVIAIHAGAQVDTGAFDRVSQLCGIATWHIEQMCQARGRVIAVADLVDVCRGQGCDCGPWAIDGQMHWRLENIHPLPTVMRARGSLGLWDLPADVETAVREQMGASVSPGR